MTVSDITAAHAQSGRLRRGDRGMNRRFGTRFLTHGAAVLLTGGLLVTGAGRLGQRSGEAPHQGRVSPAGVSWHRPNGVSWDRPSGVSWDVVLVGVSWDRPNGMSWDRASRPSRGSV